MFIIYSYDHPKSPGAHYVSGVFRHRKDAEKYLNECIQTAFKASHRLEEIPQSDYPLYFIEEDFNKAPMRPIDRFELAKKIAMMPKVDDEDHVYFNYYRFMNDYRGIRPGEDCLGATDHHHVTNDDAIWAIDSFIEKGEIKYPNRRKS